MFVEHGKHKVAEHTILDVGESAFDEGLRQEEVDQWCLVLREAQRAKALEDAGDAQVVVSAAVDRKTRIPQIVASVFIAFVGFFSVNEKIHHSRVEVAKPLFPVRGFLDFPRFLIGQLDSVEVQHEHVGLEKITLCRGVCEKTLEEKGRASVSM